MARYNACGAIQIVDATDDGLSGLFNANGSIRTIAGDDDFGSYTPDGAWRVTDQTEAEGFVGAYDADGAFNIVIVDGSVTTGMYASNGALNVVYEV